MSCKIISIEEFDNTIPVNPPIVNKKRKPKTQRVGALYEIWVPWRVASHLKILIPVGTAMIIVAAVK